jgi:hypothetical protein
VYLLALLALLRAALAVYLLALLALLRAAFALAARALMAAEAGKALSY